MNLFAGLTRAHGRYAVGSGLLTDAKGKATGSRGTRPNEPVTLELWEEHLAGKIGLGIIPLRDDATVKFAAGDVDEYPLDLVALQAKVVKFDLPLIVTRTKSGGAHLYVFFNEAVPAALARAKMSEWVTALGYPSIEIFPKQDKHFTAEGEDSTGNWINMPYQGGDNTNRYGIKADGSALSAKQYLALAHKMAIEDEQALLAIELPEVDQDWTDAPPCLQALVAQGGFSEGARNNAMFNVGVYLKKRYGDEGSWMGFVDHYNSAYFHPPLPTREKQILIRSVNKKTYNYKCRDLPIVSVCNRAVCLTRLCGVATTGDDPGVVFGEMVKLMTDPPTWIIEVNKEKIELTTDQLFDQRLFKKKCSEILSVVPNMMKPTTWSALVKEKIETSEALEVPTDATREGQLWSHLSDFCTSKVQGKALDEIMMGKPFTNEKEQRTYFRGTDFLQYLTQHRVSGVSERDLWRWLRRMEAKPHSQNLKGKTTSFWSVPSFPAQTEDFAVPRTDNPEAM